MNSELFLRVLQILAQWDEYDGLFWRFVDGEIKMFVICNDQFSWGAADLERITPDNVEQLATAYQDCHDADPANFGEVYGQLLFCARSRGMRPQGAAYPEDRRLWPLFDACGPERQKGIGNPYAPGEREEMELLPPRPPPMVEFSPGSRNPVREVT